MGWRSRTRDCAAIKGSALTPQVFLNPNLVLGPVTPAAPAGAVYHRKPQRGHLLVAPRGPASPSTGYTGAMPDADLLLRRSAMFKPDERSRRRAEGAEQIKALLTSGQVALAASTLLSLTALLAACGGG